MFQKFKWPNCKILFRCKPIMSLDKELEEEIKKGAKLAKVSEEEKKAAEEAKKKRLEEVARLKEELKKKGAEVD